MNYKIIPKTCTPNSNRGSPLAFSSTCLWDGKLCFAIRRRVGIEMTSLLALFLASLLDLKYRTCSIFQLGPFFFFFFNHNIDTRRSCSKKVQSLQSVVDPCIVKIRRDLRIVENRKKYRNRNPKLNLRKLDKIQFTEFLKAWAVVNSPCDNQIKIISYNTIWYKI